VKVSKHLLLITVLVLNVLVSTPLFLFKLYTESVVSVLLTVLFVLIYYHLKFYYFLGKKAKWSNVSLIFIGQFGIKNILFAVAFLYFYAKGYLNSTVSLLLLSSYYIIFNIVLAKYSLFQLKSEK